MLACSPSGIRGRVAVHHLHIREQPNAGIEALDQVVTKQRVFGETPAEGSPQRHRVVDAFARVKSLAEQIHVRIGNRRGVGINADIASEGPGEATRRGAGQVNADPWLQNAVAPHHQARLRIKLGLVERVGQGADQGVPDITRQLGVGVEGDHIAHPLQHAHVAHHRRVGGRVVAAQQGVELIQLPALALPAHPAPLPLVPDPAAVQQQEALGAVAFGKLPHPLGGGLKQRGVLRHMLFRCVGEISQQGEVQVLILIRQRNHLQPIQEPTDAVWGQQQGGDDHDRGQFIRDTGGEIEARQHPGRQQARNGAVHQLDGEGVGRQER